MSQVRALRCTSFFAALLAVLASAAELPPCSWSSCPVCLPQAKAAGSNVSVWGPDGQLYSTAFRLARAEAFWNSQSNVQTVLGILLREKLGVNVEYYESWDEYHSMLAMLNCAGHDAYECTEQPRTLSAGLRLHAEGKKRYPDPLPDIFASVEIWPGALQPAELGVSPQAFERGSIIGYGSVGFLVQENLWVVPEAVELAWATEGKVLTNYLAWSTDSITRFVSTPRAYIDAGVGPELPGCPGDANLSSVLADGFAALEALGYRCVDSWWLAPACAALGDSWRDGCAAVLDDDWGYPKPQVYRALAASGLRVAKLTLGYGGLYEVVLSRQFNSSFLWWDTDTQFLPLKPMGVQFQRHLAAEPIIVQKVAWVSAAKASVQIEALLRSVAITNGHLNDMLDRTMQALRDGFSFASHPEFFQKLACDWLRANEEVWAAWLPNAQSCNVGEVFVKDLASCQACPAGTAYENDGQGPLCRGCPPGYSQHSQGATSCLPCPAGSFTTEPNSTTCERCPVGSYSGGRGSSACSSCSAGKLTPTLWTSLRQVEEDGSPSWYPTDGASNVSECGCEEGSRLDTAGKQCILCGTGLVCPAGPHFQVEAGFFAEQDAQGLSVYQCFFDTQRCPGGDVGACAHGRTDIACSRCRDGMAPARGGGCVACGGADVAPAILLCLAALLFLAAVYAFSSQGNLAHMSGAVLLYGGGLAQLAATLQILSVIARISVAWPSPAAEVLSFCAEIIFGIEDIMRVDCLTTMSSFDVFAIKVLGVWGVIGVLAAMHGFTCLYRKQWSRSPLIASSGLIFQTFFISIIAMATTPLQCNQHPNGRWTTVRYDGVVCWEGGQHSWMIVFSLVASAVPIGFVALVAVLLFQCPAKIRAGDVEFLHTYAFLFARAKPEARWFLLVNLLRGFAVAMVPSIPGCFWQLFCMCAIFLAVACVVLQSKPWRMSLANATEFAGMVGFMGLLFMAMPFLEDNSINISEVFTVGLVLVFLPFPVLMVWATYKRLTRCTTQKRYKYFLCHNKQSAGALARLMKLCMANITTPDRIFLDSDQLGDLQRLFAHVRDDVELLLVLCSNQVLYSPWCLGEMATAHIHRVPKFCVQLADFVEPSANFIDNVTALVPLHELFQQAFSANAVQEALRALKDAPSTTLPQKLDVAAVDAAIGSVRGRLFSASLSTGSKILGTFSSNSKSGGKSMMSESPQTYIVCDQASSEAQCSAWVLAQMMRAVLVAVPDRFPRVYDMSKHFVNAESTMILLCTQNCFSCAEYLANIADFAAHGVDLVAPVIAGNDFQIPTKSFYGTLASTVLMISTFANMGAEMSDGSKISKPPAYRPELLNAYVAAIFDKICSKLSILGSMDILEVEVSGIVACAADRARLRLTGLDLASNREELELFVEDARSSPIAKPDNDTTAEAADRPWKSDGSAAEDRTAETQLPSVTVDLDVGKLEGPLGVVCYLGPDAVIELN